MTVTAERRTEQRTDALASANRIRFERAALKEQLRSLPPAESRELAARLLLEPPLWLATVTVQQLLSWVAGFGGKRVTFVLNASGVPGHARVSGVYGEKLLRGAPPLTERQQRVLAERLRTS